MFFDYPFLPFAVSYLFILFILQIHLMPWHNPSANPQHQQRDHPQNQRHNPLSTTTITTTAIFIPIKQHNTVRSQGEGEN
jgi:hypothetical protein